MLVVDDLLKCVVAPNINDVSLELYKEFAEKHLMNRTFFYEFTDGDSISICFTEWGIYHMLAIQHIDSHIKKTSFFSSIENGLSFDTFRSDTKKNLRFKKQKKRITMFACVYNTLINGEIFYLPSGKVRNTADVKVDYIAYDKLTNVAPTGATYNGINIGIRIIDDICVPLTVLISTNSNVTEYIDSEEKKIVKRLVIKDEDGNVVFEKNHKIQPGFSASHDEVGTDTFRAS